MERKRREGPGVELDYLDAKHNRLETLSFDEWKRREELIGGLDFWTKHVSRNADAVGAALRGLKGVVVGAMDEMIGTGLDLADGKLGLLDGQKKMAATVAEAGVLGAVDFTDLVTGVARTLTGGMDMYGREDTPEERQKVAYGHYVERQDARRERARLAKDSAIGTVAGAVQQLATGDVAAAGETQRGLAAARMANAAELGAMVTPTNPLNIIPFGAGGKAATLAAGATRAAAVTAEKMALAARWAADATRVGKAVQTAETMANPAISAVDAANLGWKAKSLALASALAAGYEGYDQSGGSLFATLGAAVGGRYVFGRAALRASKAATRVAEGSEFLAAVGRAAAQSPRLQSTLTRVARDPAVPEWAARTARTLEKAGATEAARVGRAASAGALTGAAVSGGLTAAGGADEQQIAGAIGTGAVAGGALGAAGDFLQRALGADASKRLDAERLFTAEAQREMGGDAAAARFYALPEPEQLAIGTIQALAGPAARVELLSGEDFAARVGGPAAGVHIEPPTSSGTGAVLINADAQRPAGRTALHEFAHVAAFRQNPAEIRAAIDAAVTPEAMAAFESDYLDRYIAGRKASGDWPTEPPKADSFDELGFPVRNESNAGRRAADRARAREELTKFDGEDWLHQEFFAEKGAELLSGVDVARIAETGQWEPAAARSLRTQQTVLRNAGVAFNADGTPVEGQFMGKALGEQGEKALGTLLSGYVKELADYAPRLDTEVKKLAAADAGKGPAINFGKDNAGVATHPAFAKSFEVKPDGSRESEFARVTPDGKVELKSPKEIATAEARRDAELARLFPRRGPKVERDVPLVARRDRDGGGEEISGTIMPPGFYESEAFPGPQRERARTLEQVMNALNGETVEHWYHQIGSTSKQNTWTAAVRKKLGNVRATRREVRPLSFLVTKAGNLNVRVLDILAVNAKALDLAHTGKLDMWAGNLDAFKKDLKAMLANWSQGLGGETGIGTAKHKELLDFLGKEDSTGGLIKSFRLDRMEDVRPTGRTGFTFDFGKWKRRQSPDEPARNLDPKQASGSIEKMPDKSSATPSPLFPEGNRLTLINPNGATMQRIRRENPGFDPTSKTTKVYRAAIGRDLRPNDFVALTRSIADEHLANLKDRGEEGIVSEHEVNTSDLLMANDATEFVWAPKQ